MSNNSTSDQIRLFGMKNLQLEVDLTKLEEDGYEIGHVGTLEKKEIVDPELFELDIRKSAKKMADYYVLYYCLENSVRRMVGQTMLDKYSAEWWKDHVPDDIQKEVSGRQEREKDSVMSIRSQDDPLLYATLGELIPIIEYNWDDFSDQLRSKKAVRSILSQLNQTRAVIAHSVELNEDEITRMKLLIKDWQRQQT